MTHLAYMALLIASIIIKFKCYTKLLYPTFHLWDISVRELSGKLAIGMKKF